MLKQQVEGRIIVTEGVAMVPNAPVWFPLLDRSDYATKMLTGLETDRTVQDTGEDRDNSPPDSGKVLRV